MIYNYTNDDINILFELKLNVIMSEEKMKEVKL